MRSRVSVIVVVALTALSLVSSGDASSLNLASSSTSRTAEESAASLHLVVGTTLHSAAARTPPSSVVDGPLAGEPEKESSASFTETACRNDDDDRPIRPHLCQTSKLSHVGDPVSVILKSFFDIDDVPTSPTLRQTQSSSRRKTQNSNHVQPTSPATAESDKHRQEFLWSIDTSDDDDKILESDRRRSAEEEVDDKFHADGCTWNRLSDDVSTYDCSIMTSPDNDSLTINDSDSQHFTVGELASIITVGVILGSICLATVVGNALVLVAIVSNGHLRGTTHYFMANLAVADLLLGIAVLPFSATLETINRWVFGETFCDVWAALDVLCCTASILSLCVISVDRYIGVTRPLQHSAIVTERRTGCIIVAVWLLSLAISVAPLFGWKEPREPGSDPGICNVTKQTGYVLFSVAGSFYIPLFVILIVYYRVYREAVRQSRFLATGIKTTDSDYTGSSAEITLRVHTGRIKAAAAGGSGTNSRKGSVAASDAEHHRPTHLRITVAGKVAKFKREKKAAKTLGIVVGVFVLCWFPFFFVLPLGKKPSFKFTPGSLALITDCT